MNRPYERDNVMLGFVLSPWVLLPCVVFVVAALGALDRAVRHVQGLLAQRKAARLARASIPPQGLPGYTMGAGVR